MPVFDPIKSKIKMVILLKNGNEALKIPQSNGQLINPVWYSILSKEGKSVNELIKKMTVRFFNSKYKYQTNTIIFYDNQTKVEIQRHSL